MPIATKNINAEKIQGNLDITSVTSSFTGSYIGNGAGIFGIVTSSYALTASYAMNGGGGGPAIDTGSFVTTSSFNAFTGSYNTGSFTGSYTGNGSGLFNIPASGIVGLNLSQISSGSATASISPNNGFIININTTITSSAPDIFLIKNAVGVNVLTVSQSGVIVMATQSTQLTDPAPAGGIYFTSNSMYIGI